MNPIIIVGSGLAGYSLLRELKNRTCPAPITLITADGGESYYKPKLSTVQSQQKSALKMVMASASKMAQDHHAEIITHTRVVSLDTPNHQLTLDNGEIRPYHQLVLATGASPTRLNPPGDGAKDVLSINNLADYVVFEQKLADAKRVAVIGPGLIGMEFANDLLHTNRSVTVIGPNPWPISTLIPQPIGEAVQKAMSAQGATWHLGCASGAIDKQDSGYRIALENDTVVEADLVLSAVGIRADLQLAVQSGLKTNRGILTDSYLQTSAPDVYALGDCAEVDGRNLPFVQPLLIGARALAATLTGHPQAVHYPPMPVAIKTSLHPIIILPPHTKEGRWVFTGSPDTGMVGRFLTEADKLAGFVLSGNQTAEKNKLMDEYHP
ncbi:MAG: FAD-dependent oxidoreductase [Magnetococcales bacterium]|nr:FAD-dependent oxidoreductase [Magnetococcales bacterium]